MTLTIAWRRIASIATACALAPMLQACPPPQNGNTCFQGSQVTIPSTDSTPPAEVVVDFHRPDGTLTTVTSTAPPASATITSATGGTVTLIARATDPEGVKDIQIWAAEKDCHGGTCSGPGQLGAPNAANPDNQAAGAKGCTQRLVTLNVQIGAGGTVSQEVHAVGVNFAGGQTSTALVMVGAH